MVPGEPKVQPEIIWMSEVDIKPTSGKRVFPDVGKAMTVVKAVCPNCGQLRGAYWTDDGNIHAW